MAELRLSWEADKVPAGLPLPPAFTAVGMLFPLCPDWLLLKNSKKLENRFSLFLRVCFLGT